MRGLGSPQMLAGQIATWSPIYDLIICCWGLLLYSIGLDLPVAFGIMSFLCNFLPGNSDSTSSWESLGVVFWLLRLVFDFWFGAWGWCGRSERFFWGLALGRRSLFCFFPALWFCEGRCWSMLKAKSLKFEENDYFFDLFCTCFWAVKTRLELNVIRVRQHEPPKAKLWLLQISKQLRHWLPCGFYHALSPFHDWREENSHTGAHIPCGGKDAWGFSPRP